MLTTTLATDDRTNTLDALQTTGYLLLAARLDGRAGAPSAAKRMLVDDLKSRVGQLRTDLFANVAVLTAVRLATAEVGAGDESPLDTGAGPRYDVAVLIQAPTVDGARWLAADPAFGALTRYVGSVASDTRVAVVHNVRRNACEHGSGTRQVYMLINYIERDTRDLLPAWGWTHRRQLVRDALFCRPVRRALIGYPAGLSVPTQPVLYGLA